MGREVRTVRCFVQNRFEQKLIFHRQMKLPLSKGNRTSLHSAQNGAKNGVASRQTRQGRAQRADLSLFRLEKQYDYVQTKMQGTGKF